MLPPKDLKKTGFSRVVRGYSPEEVDEHIDYIVGQYTEIYREKDELEQKHARLQSDYDNIKKDSEAIRTALINAQRAGTNLINEANKKSDVIVRTAKANCDKILAEFRAKIIVERENAQKLLDLVSEFKTGLFNTYNAHLSQVDEICTDISGLEELIIPEDELVRATLEKIKGNISEEGEKLLAEKTAAQIKSDANREAERIIIQAKTDAENQAGSILAEKTAEAEAQAEAIINKAREDAAAMEAELNVQLQSLRDEITALTEKKESMTAGTEQAKAEEAPAAAAEPIAEEPVIKTEPVFESPAPEPEKTYGDITVDDLLDAVNLGGEEEKAPAAEVKDDTGDEIDMLLRETFVDKKEEKAKDDDISLDFASELREKPETREAEEEIELDIPTPDRMNPKKGSVKDEIVNLNRSIKGGGKPFEKQKKADDDFVASVKSGLSGEISDKKDDGSDDSGADDFRNTIFFND